MLNIYVETKETKEYVGQFKGVYASDEAIDLLETIVKYVFPEDVYVKGIKINEGYIELITNYEGKLVADEFDE